MGAMTVTAVIALLLVIGAVALLLINKRDDIRLTAGTIGVVALLVALVAGYSAIMPQYRLHKAEIEKRILVEQAVAEADAAKEQARAEVERAHGTAEANKIVSNSITEPYLRYLYINNLSDTDNQVIYLPTEAGLPILEADRLRSLR
jgi:hypothetical protein